MIVRPPFPTPAAGALLAANNLSDIASAETALRNLGIYSRTNPRALRDTYHFDGSTANARIYQALGAAGALSGKAKTLLGHVYFPTAAEISGKSWGVWYMGDSSTNNPATSGNGLSLHFNTGGASVYVRQYGPTSGDIKRWNMTGTSYSVASGQGVAVALVMTPGAMPILYINGVAMAGSDGGDVGSPNPWGTHSHDYLVLGGNIGSAAMLGRNSPIHLINSALTAAEVLEWTQSGRLPLWCDVATGSEVAIMSPSLLNGGFETAGGGGADIFGSWTEQAISGTSVLARDTVDFHGGAASLRADIDASNNGIGIYQSSSAFMKNGYRYRVNFWAKKTNNGTVQFRNPADGSVYYQPALTNAWAEYTFEMTSVLTGNGLQLNLQGASSSVWVDDITVTLLGPIAKPVVQPIAVMADTGSNKIAGVLTSGVTPITDKRDWIIQALTNTNGNQQLLGASPFFDHTRQIIDDWCINNGGTSKTVSLGQASAGTQFANAITAAAGRNYVALATRVPGANALWANSNGTDNLQHTVRGHVVD